MTDKEKKSKIADILMDFQEEYSNEVINRPMLASLYAGNILSFIDSLQEEPTGNTLGSTHAEFRTAVESLGISQKEHDKIVDECIYGKEPELVDFNDMPLDPNIQYASREIGIKAHAEDYSFNIESELFQQLNKEQQELWRKEIEQACMSGGYCGLNLGLDKRYDKEEPVSNDFEMALTEMVAKAQKCVVEPWVVAAQWKDELIKLAKSEEPVSEELEEAAYHNCIDRLSKESIEDFKNGAKWQKAKDESTTEDLGEYINELSKQFPEVSFAKLSRIVVRAAKWQKQKDEKAINENALLYNARLEGIEMGKAEIKQQMMAKAIDAEVKVDAGGYPYIDKTIELYDYDKDEPLAKEGDKYKVVLIKEE